MKYRENNPQQMNDKDKIIEAWELINELTGSIKCNCNIEQDETVNIRCLYYKCQEFIKAVQSNDKY